LLRLSALYAPVLPSHIDTALVCTSTRATPSLAADDARGVRSCGGVAEPFGAHHNAKSGAA